MYPLLCCCYPPSFLCSGSGAAHGLCGAAGRAFVSVYEKGMEKVQEMYLWERLVHYYMDHPESLMGNLTQDEVSLLTNSVKLLSLYQAEVGSWAEDIGLESSQEENQY